MKFRKLVSIYAFHYIKTSFIGEKLPWLVDLEALASGVKALVGVSSLFLRVSIGNAEIAPFSWILIGNEGENRQIDAGWPPMMLTVYDECWAMSHQLKELLFLTTGNRQIGDWSIFYVDPAKSGAGWPPHRDR